jgi:hypothetical protein
VPVPVPVSAPPVSVPVSVDVLSPVSVLLVEPVDEVEPDFDLVASTDPSGIVRAGFSRLALSEEELSLPHPPSASAPTAIAEATSK